MQARDRGTPQGGVISPLLADLYLHYTFDLWMQRSYPEIPFARYADDGHFIDHACHTEKGKNDKVYAAGFIYSLNLRNGLLRPFCLVTNGTRRHQEIPVLRNQLEKQNRTKDPSQKCLYVYDKAVIISPPCMCSVMVF